jgi:uncharacterized repeat protein (TIGR01451 family)
MVRLAIVGLVAAVCSGVFADTPGRRTLTLEERDRAREALERVDGRRRIDAAQMGALEVYWKLSLTEEMLGRELQRLARETRPAWQFHALCAALGNDPFLIDECLIRPDLVWRLSRDLYAFDPTLHAEVRARAEELRLRLLTGELSPWVDHPGRTVLERAPRAGERVGQVSELEEERDGFVVEVALHETLRGVRVARYAVSKRSFEAWWATVEKPPPGASIAPVPQLGAERGSSPLPASDPDLVSFCANAGDLIVLRDVGDAALGLAASPSNVFLLDAAGTQLPSLTDAWTAPYTGVYFAGVSGEMPQTRRDDHLSIEVAGGSGANDVVDLAVTTSVLPEPVAAGGLLTYRIVMSNAGPGTALNAEMLLFLPEATTYESITSPATDGGWDCLTPAVGTRGKISCKNKCFAPSASVSFTITAKVEPCLGGMELTSSTTASSATPESNPQSNTAIATTTVIDPGTCDDGNGCTADDRCGPGIGLSEDFDGVKAPAIPSGWTATILSGPVGAVPWRTNEVRFDTAPNSVFTPDASDIRDSVLDSPEIPIVSTTAQLTFRNRYDLEFRNDGGVLEIAVGGGPFEDILDAGGSFAAGGYIATISENFGSPIHGRLAWTGTTNQFVPTTVNLPASAVGQIVVLRWRMASDLTLGRVGQWIDSVTVTGRDSCRAGTPVTCDDTDACTADACDPVAGCGHVARSCDDGNSCTDDACDSILGCVHTNKTADCDDLDACTLTDTCRAGVCVGSNPVVCNDNDACTADACDRTILCVATTADFDSSSFSAARVDGRDLAVLAGAWNSCPGGARYNPAVNLDRQDPCIGSTDFHLFMTAFGRTCPS